MMTLHFLVSNIQALFKEHSHLAIDLSEQITDIILSENPEYSEFFPEIALHNKIESYQVEFMRPFFKEKFISKELGKVFNEKYDKPVFPKFIYIDKFPEKSLNYKGSEIHFSDLDNLYKECSALANALGLVLNERDNYPGGKQKVAFNLIDIAWSAKQSKLPLIVF